MKDLKISKELLSEVLKLEVVKHSLFNKSNSSFNITYMQSDDSLKSSWMPINIYKFAFKCKEWAYSTYGIMIQSYPYCGKGRADALKGLEVDEVFKENTEVEAIIQACEWILEYKKNQCTK